jgi:hypothetical protein
MFVWDLGSLSPNLNFTDLPLTVAFASTGCRVRLSVGINGDLPHFLHSPPQGNFRVVHCLAFDKVYRFDRNADKVKSWQGHTPFNNRTLSAFHHLLCTLTCL